MTKEYTYDEYLAEYGDPNAQEIDRDYPTEMANATIAILKEGLEITCG